MLEYVFVVAAGVLEGVGKDGQSVEGSVAVNPAGEGANVERAPPRPVWVVLVLTEHFARKYGGFV